MRLCKNRVNLSEGTKANMKTYVSPVVLLDLETKSCVCDNCKVDEQAHESLKAHNKWFKITCVISNFVTLSSASRLVICEGSTVSS